MDQWLRAAIAPAEDLRFDSHYSHGGLLPSEVPVDFMPSSVFHSHQECTWCTRIQVGNTLIRIKQTK